MALSLGIEIEAVALRMLSPPTSLPSAPNGQLSLIAIALERADLPARVYRPSTTRGSGPKYNIWNVTTDVTVMEATSGAFELISPIFDTASSDWRSHLRRCVNAIGTEILWKSNRSTDLHVHIGRGMDDAKFTLEEVKKLAISYCRFESAIDQFHPAHRRMDNDYVESVRNNNLIRNSSLAQVYAMIQDADTIEEICEIVNLKEGRHFHEFKDDQVNFTSLKKHGTIGFRQHEGTIDAEKMIKWARFVLKFVNAAINNPLRDDHGTWWRL
ncbi:putative amidoligase [Diplogelasinospora grovesii]|uniref:Amidoligase n=1 Tax=Diplogelasinospora grovesii TaxID=303347 RepID=A0AAN6MYX8_9PEZI|nr:putative amidoligase [Diplogelasinospora grovesii]